MMNKQTSPSPALRAPLRLCGCLLLLASIAVHAADVTTTLLCTGTEYETTVYTIDSGKPGPFVMITGGVHGNEPAGYRAADVIRRWPIVAGRMIVIPACNVPGLRANTRNMPGRGSGDDGNLNRLFPKTGAPNQATGEPAQSLWAFIQDKKPDWFLDLHEGFDFNIANKESVGSSVIHFGDDPRAARIAKMMANAVNANITQPSRFINLLAKGPIDGSMARAAAQRLHIPGLICETTTKDQPLAYRVHQHRIMVHVLLTDLGLLNQPLAQLPDFDENAKDVIKPTAKPTKKAAE